MTRKVNGVLVPLTETEIAAREAEEAAWVAAAGARVAATNVVIRDKLLAETDWMVVRSVENPSKPVSQAMRDYRQALRDLDQQAGWPTDIVWPIKP
jgi:hypothetical protein